MTQPFPTQASDFNFSFAEPGGGLTFQDYGATQDVHPGTLQFNDFTQGVSQALNWGAPVGVTAASQRLAQQQAHQSAFDAPLDGLTAGFQQQLRFQETFDEEAEEEQPPAEPEKTPEWACAYCGIHNPSCVVKCLSTNKWFCNGRVHGTGSCIILHLVKSKNKEVQLHRDSPLGDTVLECYASGTRNLFVLGFVPVKSENTVVLLARDTPPNHPTIRDLNLDLSQWQPIVEERGLVPWLVKQPTEPELLRARHLKLDQINKLEEMWKTKPAAGVDDLDENAVAEGDGVAQPVTLKYEDSAQYQAVFEPLVKLEADYDRSIKESQSRDDITLRWDWGLNAKRVAYFYFPRDDNELKLMQGDELKLRHKNASNRGAWEALGHVLTYQQSEEVCLELFTNDVPEDCTVGFSVDFVWRGTSFDRMRNALNTFRKYSASISGYLYHLILGHPVESVTLKIPLPKAGLGVPSLPELNHSQLHAVKSVLQQPLSLIQGPPGTGKTVTSAAIVYHLAHSGTGQVLVAAPSNVAVDQLAHKMDQTGLKVVRLCAKTREAVASPVEHLTLHYQVTHMAVPEGERLRKLLALRGAQGGLNASDEKELKSLRRRLEMEVLENADVVCTTCVGAGDPRLSHFRFQHVLIDESTQAAEPECLIPMVLGAKQVILVGDHCQLGPVIMCKKAAEAGLCQSLFERLRLLGVKPIRLQVQYRMHPCLSEFPSNTFYEGTLQNGTGMGERRLAGVDFPWPNPDKPMMFWVQLGAEEISASGTSYLNRTEAAAVEKVVTRFLQNGMGPGQIGVITPYEGQRAHVVSVMVRNGTARQDLYKEIEVSSVDAFQGREKDIIVLSCVRSNEHSSIGFLSDPRRLNVALTRARFGLVVLGNPRVLSRQPLWNSLLQYFKEHGCLVEGPLTNLKASMVQLHKPKRVFDRMSFGVGALTTNRYQPPEKVGDPLPPKATPGYGPAGSGQPGSGAPFGAGGMGQQLQFAAVPPTGGAAAAGGSGAGASGSGNRYSSRAAAAAAGRGGGSAGAAAAAAAAAGRAGASQTFMPFAAPTYSIPAPAARGKGPRGDSPASQATSDLSLPGVYTQPAAVAGGTTQGTLPATQALTGLGGASQLAGGAAAAALPYGFTADFSQTSGYGGLGAAGVGMGVGALGGLPGVGVGLGGDVDFNSQVDNFLLSQGFGNETQFLDAATGEFLGGFGGATQDR
ncbi:hypothetical protein HXX76_007168 [Chlamydomonas incerta]|uniref:Upf1 domain-containing protein n=1 Tax=Chlamydomonas incerta TaxID=51695 RepID=A0A835TBF5_CHLIN|nr:hypothetical protein HXX76_007168 [Chlamydomonas incerta]|eukprot:KAG2435081.1 hypothetical protein HXX76_007168 [Chlamydomonas incerta]